MRPEESWRIARTAAVQACIQIGLLSGLVFWLHGGTWIPTKDPAGNMRLRPRSDFMTFYASGLLIRENPDQLYDAEAQARAQRIATGLDISDKDIDFLPFGYPPFVALLFAPLTLFGYTQAYFVIAVVNILLIGAVVWILVWRLSLGKEQAALLVMCASALISVYAVLVQGQVSFLILLFYALIITDLRHGFTMRPGIWAGFVALKPPVLPVLLLWLAVRRYWRALGGAIVVMGLLGTVSVLLVGKEGAVEYLDMSSRIARGDFYSARIEDMQNLRAITHFGGWSDVVWLFSLAVLLGILLWPRRARLAHWDYCALLLAVILAAPHLKIQEMDLLLIMLALALAYTKPSTASRRWAILLLTLMPAVFEFTMTGPNGLYWPILPFAMIGLFVFFTFCSNKIPIAAGSAGLT